MQTLKSLPPPAYALVLGLIGVLGNWLGTLISDYDPGVGGYVMTFVIFAVLGWTLARKRQTDNT